MRLGLARCDLEGGARFGPLDLGSLPPVIVGLDLTFQALYRDVGSCAGASVNTTNSYVITVRN
jgi:hypothetical protein